ncbi:MAG: hypothetical protein Kow0059_08650 [Candidatus Sumerlaeia bacterium]
MTRRVDKRAFTLIEAMVTVVLIVILGVTIITVLIQTFRTHQLERERVVALNAASRRMEELKRQLFSTLSPSTSQLTLDVHNTPTNAADDISATMRVVLRDRSGNTISAPVSNNAVRLEVTVEWNSQSKLHAQTVHTILTP